VAERETVREAVLYLPLSLKILLLNINEFDGGFKVITICQRTIKASNNNKIVKDTFKVILDIYTLAQS
jgi:hypothetical protein